jgi:transcriptional regulator with XRE-family HTH domain
VQPKREKSEHEAPSPDGTQRLPQERFGKLADVYRTYISRVELGQVRLGLDVAQKLAAGLGMPLSDMIVRAEERTQSSRG